MMTDNELAAWDMYYAALVVADCSWPEGEEADTAAQVASMADAMLEERRKRTEEKK